VRLDNDAGVSEALTADLPLGRGTGLTFRGLNDQEAVTVTLAPDTARWDARTNGKWVHDSFGAQKYLSIELRSPDGITLASGAANGNQTAQSLVQSLHGQPYEDGQYLLVHHREPQRLVAHSAGAALPRTGDRDQAFRVDAGTLQRIPVGQVATPPALTVQPGLGSTIATLTMSASVFEKASRHVVRHGGEYAFEIHRGSAYYASTTRHADGTVTVSTLLPAGKGDVSLHRVPGKPGGPTTDATLVSTHAEVTGQPTAAQRAGVYGFYVAPGTLGLRMSSTAYTSTTRHLVYVNGAFVFEVHAGTQYGARRTASGGITVVEAALPRLSPHDVVEVRLASGQPGDPRHGVAVRTYTITAADIPLVLTPR
jgi:hypothetical protein